MPRRISSPSAEPVQIARLDEKPSEDERHELIDGALEAYEGHELVADQTVFYALCPCGREFLGVDDQVDAVQAEAAAHIRDCLIAQQWKRGGLVNIQHVSDF